MITSIEPFIRDVTMPIAGKVYRFLDMNRFVPRRLSVLAADCKADSKVEFIFDYYDHRYHFLLLHNPRVRNCPENALLENVSNALAISSGWHQQLWECLDLFWPSFLALSDKRTRPTQGLPDTFSDRFLPKETVCVQMSSSDDGTIWALRAQPHDLSLVYPLSEPVKNPCPRSVPRYTLSAVSWHQEIYREVFKVVIGGEVVCVKAAPAKALLTELKAMLRMPSHANVNQPLLGVIETENGLVDKLVVPFIKGKTMSMVRHADVKRKEAWKSQIIAAVDSLHASGVTWGDVFPRNVVIEDGTDKAMVVDFGLSNVQGDSAFDLAKQEDMANLENLIAWVDKMSTTPK